MNQYSICILSDRDSWINPGLTELKEFWSEQGHSVFIRHNLNEEHSGDFCFCLSFGKILSGSILSNFKHVLVVHESDLPYGKGWSPLTWQIIEGKNLIPVSLFEAAKDVDSGPIYAQKFLHFRGDELVDELRMGQFKLTKELCIWFIQEYPDSLNFKKPQNRDNGSYYPRRHPIDSELDPHKTIYDQFNLLRTVDNDNYPAFFLINDNRYEIKIYKA